MGMKMVAACMVVVAAVALMSGDVCNAETKAECLNKCVSRCMDTRVGLCSINCAVGCHWPFSRPTSEGMFDTQGLEENGVVAAAPAPAPEMQADQEKPLPLTPQNSN